MQREYDVKTQEECHLQVHGYWRLPEVRGEAWIDYISQPSKETNPANTLISNFSLPNCEAIHFYC